MDEGGEPHYTAGYLSGYEGGPIRLTLALGPSSCSLSTDTPPFSMGPINYASAFPTFTREDLDPASHVCLGNDAVAGGFATCSVDRVTLDVELSTPVEKTTLGRIKALYRH